MEFTEKDAKLMLTIARSHDAQQHALKAVLDRLDPLESHWCDAPEPPPSKNYLQIHVTVKNAYSPAETQLRMEQLRLELLALLDEYGVETRDGRYQRR